MTTIHQTECKFCGSHVECEIDESYMALRSPLLGDVPTLIKLAACNRCADYENAKRRLRDETEKCARTLSLEIYARRHSSPLAETSRSNLRVLFSKWFECVCGHFLIETVKDDEFVSLILSKPHNWANAFYRYEKGCRTIAVQAHKAA